MTTDAELAEQLGSALTLSGISRSRAAERIGVSEKQLSWMLAGTVPMSSYWSGRIAALCGYRIVVTLEKNEDIA